MRAPEGGPARGSGPGSKVRGFISGPGFKVRGFVSGPGFKVRGFVSGRLRPIFPAPGPSWGRPHRSASMDSSKEDSGRTRAPPGGALTAQPAWTPARRILGGHGPLLGAPSPLSQYGFQQGGFWEDTWTRPFPILPVGSDL